MNPILVDANDWGVAWNGMESVRVGFYGPDGGIGREDTGVFPANQETADTLFREDKIQFKLRFI